MRPETKIYRMITVEVRNQDMVAATAQGRTNLPGT